MTREQVVEAFRKRVADAFGSEPAFTSYDTPIVIDNPTRKVSDDAAATA